MATQDVTVKRRKTSEYVDNIKERENPGGKVAEIQQKPKDTTKLRNDIVILKLLDNLEDQEIERLKFYVRSYGVSDDGISAARLEHANREKLAQLLVEHYQPVEQLKRTLQEALDAIPRRDLLDDLNRLSESEMILPTPEPTSNTKSTTQTDTLTRVSEVMANLKKLYAMYCSRVKPFPWLGRVGRANLKEHFCSLHLVTHENREELRQAKPDDPIPELYSRLRKHTPLKLGEIFDGEPRRILIEGEPGIGKTSLCLKLAADWSQGEAYMTEKFKGLFFIRARNIKAKLREYLSTVLRMSQGDVEQLWKCVLNPQYQKLFFFIIDGLDEVVQGLPIECIDLIEGKIFFNSCVLVTSRTNQWQSKLSESCELDELFDREILNVGFTQETAFEFINSVANIKSDESQPTTLKQFILQHEFLDDLIRSPLICIFLCIMWNENCIQVGEEGDEFRRTLLYTNMVECLVKRFCQRTIKVNYKLINGKLSPSIKEKLSQVYKVAYCAFQEGKVQISLDDIQQYLQIGLNEDDVMFSFGILVKETEFLEFNEETVYVFPHRSVQEELSSEYYVTMPEKERVAATKWIVDKLPLVCIFSSGLVYHRNLNPTTLIPLFGELSNQLVMANTRVKIALECVFECGYQTLLTDMIAGRLPQTVELDQEDSSAAICGLLKCLTLSEACVSSVLIEPVLSFSRKSLGALNISELASVFNNNLVLTDLYLTKFKFISKKASIHNIDANAYEYGWESLADGLKANTTLTQLCLIECEICDRGWEALAKGLKDNMTLTQLDLNECKISDKGGETLGEGLKANTALREALQANKALTKLDLRSCEVFNREWEALGEILKANKAIKELDLNLYEISDGGWEALSKGLKTNTALIQLHLDDCEISKRGGEALGDALKSNVTLMQLDMKRYEREGLSESRVPDRGCEGLTKGLKANITLTHLDMNKYEISDRGCENLGEWLMANTAMTQLVLNECKIYNRGWENLAKGLKANTALTQLHLRSCEISDSGGEALGEGLKINTALTQLDLSGCKLSDKAGEALAEGLKSNTTMTQLDLYGCKISDSVREALKGATQHQHS